MDELPQPAKRRAVRFIVLLGIISLLADVTYEGARGISGPFLATLGASGVAVGFIAGAGELIGYGLRYFSGLLADRSRRYWTIIGAGYAVNLLAVPALALAGNWQVAAALLIVERIGKAIRAPARDVVLSSASSHVGMGWGFGLHEAMDQIGAVSGPLLMAAILASGAGYSTGFAWLAVPALGALVAVAAARFSYPTPGEFERKTPQWSADAWPRAYWFYLAAAGMMAFGFVDFALLAFHFKSSGHFTDAAIPMLYSLAMGVDAIAALVFGRLYDRLGARVAIAAAVLTAIATPLAIFGGVQAVVIAMICWGAALGAHESVLKAAIADIVPHERRGAAYGLYHSVYGLFWFTGSVLLGALRDASPMAMAACSIGAQVVAAALLCTMKRCNGESLLER